MRKEELDRRAAELKARVLAQRGERLPEPPSAQAEQPTPKRGREHIRMGNQPSEEADVEALKRRVKELEAENGVLRRQLAAMASSGTRPSQSSEDSVREQRHNFFKYSNIRRY